MLAFLFLAHISFSQTVNLTGTWVLNKFETDATVTQLENPDNQVAVTSETTSPGVVKNTVPLKDVLAKKLKPGVTKFVFTTDKFEFYRTEKVAHAGEYSVQNSDLVVTYQSNGVDNKRTHKIVSVTDKMLVLDSDLDGHIVQFTFTKK